MATRDIKIKKVLNGYIVKIGCQKVVFTKRKKLLKELARYWDDPEAVEKEYLEKHKAANLWVGGEGARLVFTGDDRIVTGLYTGQLDINQQEARENLATDANDYLASRQTNTPTGEHYNIIHDGEILHGGIFMTPEVHDRLIDFIADVEWDWEVVPLQPAESDE